MYQLKRLFKRHAEENFLKYISVLSVFIAGILLGFVFSKGLSVDLAEGLNQEMNEFIEGFSMGNVNSMEILKNSFLKNMRIALLIFLGGFSVWLAPVAFGAILIYGFSLGFTVGYMSLYFGGIGVGIAVASIFFGLIINVPVYIILTVIAFNNSIGKKHNRGDGGMGTYTLIFGILFSVTLVTMVTDAFVVPVIVGLICS